MKIGHPADKLPPANGAGSPAAAAETGRPAAAAQTGQPAARADASATVELSPTAAGLISPGSSPEFDADKVARMTDAIAGGTFKINADAIADKLIANAQELLTKAKS